MLKRAIFGEVQQVAEFLLTLALYPKFKFFRLTRSALVYKKLTLRGLLYRRGQLGKLIINLGIAALAALAVIGGTIFGPLPSLALQTQPKNSVVATPNDPKTTIPQDRPRATTIQYQVKDGDTLQTVAAKYSVSTDTITWANGLGPNNLTPGQTILVPPVTGVVHIVGQNETLAQIASAYGVKVTDIQSYPFNDIPDNQNLEQGQIIVVPNGRPVEIVHPAPPPPSPAPAPVQTGSHPAVAAATRYVPPAPVVHFSTYNSYPFGQCTYYVASRRNIPWLDNAGGWYRDAIAAGFAVGRTPRTGAIMVSYEGSPYGHVSYVERVNPNGSWVVKEMNYAGIAGGGWGRVDTRTVNPGTVFVVGFIY